MLEYYVVGKGKSFCMGVVTKTVTLAPASMVTVPLKSTVEVQQATEQYKVFV